MVTSTNSQHVGSGGWAAAVSTRGLGQSILLSLMALSVISGVLASPSIPVDQSGFQQGEGRRDSSSNSNSNSALGQRMVGGEGRLGSSAARVRSRGERLGHNLLGAAPSARRHDAKQKIKARAVVTRTITSRASSRTSSAKDDGDEGDQEEEEGAGDTQSRRASSSVERASSTRRRTTSSSRSSTQATSTYSARPPAVFQAISSTSSSIALTSAAVPSTTAEAALSTTSSVMNSSQAEALNSNDSTSVNKIAATVAGSTSAVAAFSTQSKLFPVVVVIIVCGVLALLFLLFLGIRGYRWRQQEKAEEIRRAQLAERGIPPGFGGQAQRSRSSRIKAGARTLRKALSSERLGGGGGGGGAPPSVQLQQGSVLLQVGDEVLNVPAEVAEEYQAAKRIYGGNPNMWNSRLYLSQCLARYERNEHLRGGAPYTPSPLSNVAAWNHSASTLTSDPYLHDEKRMEEKQGLSSRLMENLRSLRSANGADETEESIDPEKRGTVDDSTPVVIHGRRQQWGITSSISSGETIDVEEPARRSSELHYAPFTPQTMPSPIVLDTSQDSPLPRQMSVLLRQKEERRHPSTASIRQTIADQRVSWSVCSPRLIPLPASPMPGEEEDQRHNSLPVDLPKVTLEDKPSQEARTRIVSRRLRSRLSTITAMPPASSSSSSAADAYGPNYPSRSATTSSPLHMSMPMPMRAAMRARAASYAVGSEAVMPNATGPRNYRATSVPAQNPQATNQPGQLTTGASVSTCASVPVMVDSSPAGMPVVATPDPSTSSPPLLPDPLPLATAAPRWPSRREEEQGVTSNIIVCSEMSPLSSRDRLQSARADLELERERERQRQRSRGRGVSYHGGGGNGGTIAVTPPATAAAAAATAAPTCPPWSTPNGTTPTVATTGPPLLSGNQQRITTRYVSGPAIMVPHRKASPVWTRQQSLE